MSSGCIVKDGVNCDIGVFVGYFISLSLLYTIVLTFVPSVITAIKKVLESRKTNNNESNEDEISIRSRNIEVDEGQPGEPLELSAYVTMVFFYFQIAALVHVKMQLRSVTEYKGASDDGFQKSLFDFFNFRFTIYRKLCPMNELTLPIKEFINIGLKLCSIINLFFFFLHCALSAKILTIHKTKCCQTGVFTVEQALR